jgi:hypothetical protein
MNKKSILIGAIAFSAFCACSKSGDTGGTGGGGNFTPDCSVAKTFSADASPVFQSSCASSSSCHGSGSGNGPGELTTYTQIFNARSAIRGAVASGRMPKTGTLSSAQKNAVLCWIDSGAPNN